MNSLETSQTLGPSKSDPFSSSLYQFIEDEVANHFEVLVASSGRFSLNRITFSTQRTQLEAELQKRPRYTLSCKRFFMHKNVEEFKTRTIRGDEWKGKRGAPDPRPQDEPVPQLLLPHVAVRVLFRDPREHLREGVQGPVVLPPVLVPARSTLKGSKPDFTGRSTIVAKRDCFMEQGLTLMARGSRPG